SCPCRSPHLGAQLFHGGHALQQRPQLLAADFFLDTVKIPADVVPAQIRPEMLEQAQPDALLAMLEEDLEMARRRKRVQVDHGRRREGIHADAATAKYPPPYGVVSGRGREPERIVLRSQNLKYHFIILFCLLDELAIVSGTRNIPDRCSIDGSDEA